jgi:hypothetical protein
LHLISVEFRLFSVDFVGGDGDHVAEVGVGINQFVHRGYRIDWERGMVKPYDNFF